MAELLSIEDRVWKQLVRLPDEPSHDAWLRLDEDRLRAILAIIEEVIGPDEAEPPRTRSDGGATAYRKWVLRKKLQAEQRLRLAPRETLPNQQTPKSAGADDVK